MLLVVPNVVLPDISVTVPVGILPNPFVTMFTVMMSLVTEVVEVLVGTTEICVLPCRTVKVTGALVLAL
jgi:hypothetical protein